MAQADGVVANGTGSAVRADINGQLAALFTNHSGSTEPATTFAFQTWADTNTNTLKLRNSSNDGWVQLARLDGQFDAKTFNSNVTLNAQSDLRFADSDSSNWVAFQAPATVASNVTWTLPSADGTSGQSLTTNGSGTLSWSTATADTITEGNTSAEVVDTGSDGHFKVVTEGTEALRVDSSQRVGIGTTSPPARLSAHGTGPQLNLYHTSTGSLGANFHYNGTTGALQIATNGNNASSSPQLVLDLSGRLLVGTSTAPSGGFSQYAKITVASYAGSASGSAYLTMTNNKFVSGTGSNEAIGLLTFGPLDADNAFINCRTDGTQTASSTPGNLAFHTTPSGSTTPTERMRIGSDGTLLNFSAGNGIVSGNSAAAGTSTELFLGIHSRTSTTGGGTTSFRVWTNGNVQNTNNSYTAISDIKLKENIVDASSQWDDLKALRVRNYNFKEETGQQTHTQLGVIAQEIELVCPGLVSESPDRENVQIPILDENGDAVLDENGDPTFAFEERETGEVTKSVNYSVLYMKAVKALQEAMERIETLETANASLEARLTALEGGA